MRKIGILGLIVFGVFIVSLICPLSGQAQEKRDFFKVGVVTSLSGELAFGGSVTKRGYDMWEDAINAQGGIDIGGKKYKVKLVYADDQSTPATAAVAGERLITQEKVDFILGPYASGPTLALAPITEKYKMPHITGSAESPLIWLRTFKYTFGTLPPVNLTAQAIIGTLAKEVSPQPKTSGIV